MAGRRLRDLLLPSPEYDPAVLLCAAEKRFETALDAANEDRKRARLLKRQVRDHSTLVDGRRAGQLGCRLDRRNAPPSLASSRQMRHLRRQIAGGLMKLVRDED